MKVAAIQMNVEFTNVEKNITSAERLIKKAIDRGVKLIVLPEFFTTAMGFDSRMLEVPNKTQNKPKELFSRLAKEYNVIRGGSYINFDGENSYNSFILVFPNGKIYYHNKDIPTQLENCYFTGGNDDGIFDTPIGKIGVAMCWEMIRYDTLKRLNGRVDLLLACSCWWDLPEDAPKERDKLRLYNRTLANETPVKFAKLIGVPLIHAGHSGKVIAYNFPKGDKLHTRQLVGSTQIIDSNGNVIKKVSFREGESIIISELKIGERNKNMSDIMTEKYWIPNLPIEYIKAWKRNNKLGKEYYENITIKCYKENKKW